MREITCSTITDAIKKMCIEAATILPQDVEKALYDIDQIQTNDNQTKSGIIDAFVESIVKNEEPVISGKSVLSAMRAVFASIEASECGHTVKIRQ